MLKSDLFSPSICDARDMKKKVASIPRAATSPEAEWRAARKSRSGEADDAGGRRWRSARKAAISVHPGREECVGPTAIPKCRPVFPRDFEDMHLNRCMFHTMKNTMAMNPFDSSKLVMRSMVT